MPQADVRHATNATTVVRADRRLYLARQCAQDAGLKLNELLPAGGWPIHTVISHCGIPEVAVKLLRRLIECGADLEAPRQAGVGGSCLNIGMTALHIAVQHRTRAVAAAAVAVLLAAGANPNARVVGPARETVLMRASRMHPRVVQQLLLAGADAGAKDAAGQAAVDYAATNLADGEGAEERVAEIRALLLEAAGQQVG